MTFTSGGSTLCTATLPLTSCDTSSSLDPAAYPVTATYSGDSNYNGAVATGASFTVTRADTSMTESAAPATIAYGAQDTLSASGLPGGCDRDRDLHLGRLSALHRDAPGAQLPDIDDACPGHVPGDRDVLR